MDKSGILRAIIILSVIVSVSCAGSNSTTNQSSTPSANIVGEVGGESVTYSELKQNYLSGSLNTDYTLSDLQDFLPVYLDYKAKIIAADEAGYFEDETILAEFGLYSKQAAYAFWLDKVIKPKSFEKFKERYSKELKTSHILIQVAPNASPADTLESYNKLIEARDKILAGTPLLDLDAEYSSKQQGRSMGGDLPWFSVGTVVKPFEDTIYGMEVGEISMPFRTQFGYHIVLLEDVRERKPSRSVSHIFVRPGDIAYKIDTAYAALQRGSEWQATVNRFSEDRPSVQNGGDIGWVNYGRYDDSFVDVVMDMDPEQPFSEPFKTTYGFHIIRIDSVQTFESDEAKDAFLMRQLEASSAFQENNGFVINWLKEENNSSADDQVLGEIIGYVTGLDSTQFSRVTLPEDLNAATIYTFSDGITATGADYIDYLKATHGNEPSKSYRSAWFINFQEALIDNELVDYTLREYPEFSEQVESYRKGLVVYQINDDSLWNASTVDTTILMDMYQQNPGDYEYDTRYHFYLVTARQDTSIGKAKAFINAGNPFDSLSTSGIAVGLMQDSTEAFQGEPFNLLPTMEEGTFSEIFEYNSRKGAFYLVEILPPRVMTYSEAFNKLVSDYQPLRESNWLQSLRDRYAIRTFPENLDKAYSAEIGTQ